MKRLLIVCVAAFAISGCTVTTQQAQTKVAEIQAKVLEVQSIATRLCAFVPTANTVIGIFSTGAMSTVGAVAQAVCNAITTRPLADGPGRKAKVAGVTVRGQFVR